MISITDILGALSDDKALSLFNIIALAKSYDSKTLMKNIGITQKQFYHRLYKRSNAGLVKRANGKHTTTALGNIVCEALSMVNRCLKYYFVLKAIEVLQTSAATDLREDKSMLVTKLIDSLIDDSQLKNILTSCQNIKLQAQGDENAVAIDCTHLGQIPEE